jgi:sugar lactone lactonase YvrE
MWNNFQSFICEKVWIWDNGTKTVHNHPMQHTHTLIFSMKQLLVYCDYSLRNQSQIVQYPARFLLNNAATSPEKNK